MKFTHLVRSLRVAALGFAILVTLVGLVIAYENWHGPRALRAETARLAAKGESLDYASYFPPRLPAEKNFMADPFLQMVDGLRPPDPAFTAAYGQFRKRTENYWPLGRTWAQGVTGTFQSSQKGTRRELSPEEVLSAFATIEPQILRLRRRAVECSLAQFDPEPDQMRPAFRRANVDLNFGEFLQLSRGFAWQAAVELRLGKNTDAYADTLVLMKMVSAAHSYPALLSGIVEIGMLDSVTQLFWEGCLTKSWSRPQLEVFLNFFVSANVWETLVHDLQAERARFMTLASTDPNAFFLAMTSLRPFFGGKLPRLQRTSLGYLMRFGIVSENTLAALAGFDGTIDCIALAPVHFDITKAQEDVRQRSTWWERTNPYRRYGQMLSINPLEMEIRAAQVPPGWEIGAIVAALELYHGAHQDYPEKLEDLVPTYLAHVPVGIATGTLPNYRRIDRADFRLTSGGLPEPAWEWHTSIGASEPASSAR